MDALTLILVTESEPTDAIKQAIAKYEPRADTCSPQAWTAVADTTRRLVTEAAVGTSPRQVRMYLGAVAGLLGWMQAQGYGLDVDLAMSGPTIESYVATLRYDHSTMRGRLRKIAIGNGYDPLDGLPARYRKREYQEPYSEAELSALWDFGQQVTNRKRGLSICAVVALSAGCGFRVRDLHDITVDDVHTHPHPDSGGGDDGVGDGGVLCVRGGGRCVPVRPECVEWLELVVAEREEGPLVAAGSDTYGLGHLVEWVKRRARTLDFSVYRLRSTWLCRHLNEGTPVLDVLAWGAIGSFDSLDGYRQHLDTVDASCSDQGDANG